MGLHAFTREPQHCALYRLADVAMPPLVGLGERWNMPTASHRAALGDGATFPGVDHYILTYQLDDTPVHRLDRPRFDGVARQGAISLQRPGSGGTFRSAGAVAYAHFYFHQSLLCELGDTLGLGRAAEVDDVFAVYDGDLAGQLDTYVRRSGDADEPPTAIEMDSRAYLIGLGLLRSLARPAVEEERLEPAGLAGRRLARVADLIEAKMGDVVRLSDLAAAADLSPFHFTRAFRRTTGQTPAAYLMQRRIERARDLVERTDLSLAEIAARTGFASQSHMTKRFKQTFATTPGALRKAR
ncbi:MAG: helix-turn-helix transcriptional regulator [Pseudomonadota bacterium]